jgi:hypothetical protein
MLGSSENGAPNLFIRISNFGNPSFLDRYDYDDDDAIPTLTVQVGKNLYCDQKQKALLGF